MAFDGGFSDDDWEHSLGGMHALVLDAIVLVAHGALVARRFLHHGRSLRCGYVEAVAAGRSRPQGAGLGHRVMDGCSRRCRAAYDLLGTQRVGRRRGALRARAGYRDIEAAQRHLVDVFGLVAGELTRDGDGRVVHGEVFAGDGVIWMHQESEEFRLASPATSGHGIALHGRRRRRRGRPPCRAVAAGAEIVYEPTEMPYGVREYAARDSEGGLWSFMQPLTTELDRED